MWGFFCVGIPLVGNHHVGSLLFRVSISGHRSLLPCAVVLHGGDDSVAPALHLGLGLGLSLGLG
jgi:hypothetical protein